MKKSKFTYIEFCKLLKLSKFQFILKSNSDIYFISPNGYESYNENGFVAHNETNGKIEIINYSDIIEVTIDCKKYNY